MSCLQLRAGVVGMKLGFVKEAFAASDPQIATKVRAAVNSLQEQGAHVEEVSVPHFNKGYIEKNIKKS